MVKNVKFVLSSLLLMCSLNSFAALVCPNPDTLNQATLSFHDVSDYSELPKPSFIAEGYFVSNNKVWILTTGIFDENRPRLQARQLLEKAMSPQVEIDEDDGSEQCVYYLSPKGQYYDFVVASEVPEMLPCPSLETMKNTAFIGSFEACENNHSGCGDYYSYAELNDHGKSWLLYSLVYNDPNSAISEAETLKEKAYSPVYAMGNACIYFSGMTQNGPRAIVSIPNTEYKGSIENTGLFLKKSLQKNKGHFGFRFMNRQHVPVER